MVNKQLIDFIKQQSQNGITREVISKELLAGDWTLQDIEEGFKSIGIASQDIAPVVVATSPAPAVNPVNTPPTTFIPVGDSNLTLNLPPESNFIPAQRANPVFSDNFHSTPSNWVDAPIGENSHTIRNVILTILGLFLFAGGAFGYIFRNDLPIIKDYFGDKSQVVIQEPITESQISNVETSASLDLNTEDLVSDSAQDDALFERMNNAIIDAGSLALVDVKPIDCGTDMNCFIKNVKNCLPSFVENTMTVKVLGMFNQTNKQKISLTGFDSSKKCGYENLVKDVVSLSYTPEMQSFLKSEMEKDGKILTSEQIQEAFIVPTESLNSAKSTIGLTTKCSFATTYLTELFTRWNAGEYNSTDMDHGNCVVSNSNGKSIPVLQ